VCTRVHTAVYICRHLPELSSTRTVKNPYFFAFESVAPLLQ
jgi:hypothetical protein